MKAKPRPKLRYADVMATIAVFLALGGGAWAAAHIAPANSVNSRSIVDGQVKRADIATSAVSSAKIGDGQISSGDLADSAVIGAKLATGAVTNPKLAPGSVNSSSVLDNSLTGADLNESTLAPVPNASHATSADSAANAQTLGGSPASSFVAGGGKVAFARVSVPDGTGSGEPILVLPGLGRIETYACNGGSVVFAAQYHNTTSQPEDLWLQEQDEDGESNSYQRVGAEAAVALTPGGLHGWEHYLLTVGSGFGPAAEVATSSVGVASASGGTKCVFQAQATVQPGE